MGQHKYILGAEPAVKLAEQCALAGAGITGDACTPTGAGVFGCGGSSDQLRQDIFPADKIARAVVDKIRKSFALGLLPLQIRFGRNRPDFRFQFRPDVLKDRSAPGLKSGDTLPRSIPLRGITPHAGWQLPFDALFQCREATRPIPFRGIRCIIIAKERGGLCRHLPIG
jgi:hypothetical protein